MSDRAWNDLQTLYKWTNKTMEAKKEKDMKEEMDQLAQAPVASLMYEEVERRIDVFLFRCCFAHSVYEARRMVIHGWVKLNGKTVSTHLYFSFSAKLRRTTFFQHTNANTRIAPGDMVSVDPEAIAFLRNRPEPEKTSEPAESLSESSSEGDEETTASSPPENTSTPTKPEPEYIRAEEERERANELTPFNLPPYAAPFVFIPAYIEVNFLTCSAIFVRRPTARYNYSEIPSPYEADGEIMRLSWEWYNKVRPRMRSKRQLARMPENRREVRVIPGVTAPPHLAKMARL